MDKSAPATMGTRPGGRDHAIADDAIHRVLATCASRRLWRARHGRLRTLCQLEWAAADPLRDAAAGHLLLGPDRLSDRRHGVPAHRPTGAYADGSDACLHDPPVRDHDGIDY